MDKTEHSLLSTLPANALSLKLTRTPIRMKHSKNWKINKLNPDHDLVICLTGSATYQIDNRELCLEAGEAMLIPGFKRFRGRHSGQDELYTGIAQHFSLELFGRGDIINKMQLCPLVRLNNWEILQPLVQHYRDSNSKSMTNLIAHHQFMVLLLAYLDQALEGWLTEKDEVQSEDHISLQIMLVTSQLSADPQGTDSLDEILAKVPYNKDYFRRAFRDRMGMTPRKFRELKRMEFAVHRLGVGLSVKEVAAELDYSDPYFFSRLFKQYIGSSPSKYRRKGHELSEED